jgi:hypothetical protein
MILTMEDYWDFVYWDFYNLILLTNLDKGYGEVFIPPKIKSKRKMQGRNKMKIHIIRD